MAESSNGYPISVGRIAKHRVVEVLLERHGHTYSNEAGISLRDTPTPLFRLLILSILLSDGSIGSNDLTQLTLGVDRDSERLASLFDERDPAVVTSIERLIEAAHSHGRKVGLCGQRPSDDPEFADLLVRAGIDSISVSPDSFLQVKEHIAAAEARLRRD